MSGLSNQPNWRIQNIKQSYVSPPLTSYLFCSVLFCSVLFCSVPLFCSVLFCSVLFCSVLFCSVPLLCSVLFCSVLFSDLFSSLCFLILLSFLPFFSPL